MRWVAPLCRSCLGWGPAAKSRNSNCCASWTSSGLDCQHILCRSLSVKYTTDTDSVYLSELIHRKPYSFITCNIEISFNFQCLPGQLADGFSCCEITILCEAVRNTRVRFTVTATRGGGDAKSPQGVQLAEFLLWRQGATPMLSIKLL